MKVVVTPDCIGCGACEFSSPEVFKMNSETGVSDVIKEDPEDLDGAIEVAKNCPAEAIQVFDDDDNQVYPKE